MDYFDYSFQETVGHEGGYSTDRDDRGNWTSGRVGRGQLKGTKYGVSAMSYPHLDIRNLTLDQAKEIYREDYWNRARCDELPVPLNFLVFDAAVNHGVTRAVKFLQMAVKATPDGAFGPLTLAAVQRADPELSAIEFCSQRMLFYTGIRTWWKYKTGWTRRAFSTLFAAARMD